MNAACVLKCNFPESSPAFALQLNWLGQNLNASNNESIRVSEVFGFIYYYFFKVLHRKDNINQMRNV